jgi:hypothetical protein
MPNTRVEYLSGDVGAGQLAPSQANRTNFTPGTTTARANDMNWPTDFRIPTGTPAFDGEAAGPVLIERSRVVLTGRNTVSDVTIFAPVAGTPGVTTITDTATWGSVSPTSTLTPTDTQVVDGRQERRAGYDNIKGA